MTRDTLKSGSQDSFRIALQSLQNRSESPRCPSLALSPITIPKPRRNEIMNKWNHNLQDDETIEETAFNQMMEDLNESVEHFPEENSI